MTRGATTLIGVAVAGFLTWWGGSALPAEGDATIGEFWWAVGLIAAAGLIVALSQLVGGWTKWGRPRISRNVFLLGFLPALIAGGWVVVAAESGDHWLGSHVRNWSGDIGLESVVEDLAKVWPAVAFGVGLVLGLAFDTAGPRKEPVPGEERPEAAPVSERETDAETPEPETPTPTDAPRREEDRGEAR